MNINNLIPFKMKTTLKFIFLTILVIGISSCKKEDAKLPFNQLSEEDNKQLVEDSAIKAAKAFDQMKDEPAVEGSVSMIYHMDMASPMDKKSVEIDKAISTLKAVAAMNGDDGDINDLLSAIRDPKELSDDPESIQEAWDMLVGTYTWNSSMDDWDYTENPNEIVFIFPSTENGTSNNATFTVSNYTGVMISNPLEDDYSGDLPASLNMELVIDGETAMTYVFAAEYNSDGIPTSLASDLTMGTFVLSADMTNNDTEVSANYKFTNDGETVMEISGALEGDFSDENIQNNTVTYTETYEWTDYIYNENTQMYEEVIVTEVDEWEEVDIEEIIQSGHFKFRLYDISIGGTGDIKALVDTMDLIYPEDYYDDPNYDDKTAAQQEAAALNNNLHIYAIDEASRKKIADVEAYVVEENYGDGYYSYWVDFRLVFGDGSLVDLETYFEQGFEDFVAEINSMIRDLNGQYDLDLDQIDY